MKNGRVAVIGAGLSGLACAFELKRNGIIPVVFEKTNSLGGGLSYLISVLRIFNDFYISPQKYLKSRYDLDLKPVGTIHKVVMHGPSRVVTVKGKLGYIFSKGMGESSIENQLTDLGDIDVTFESFVNIGDIEKDFDHIVVATGNHMIANELRDFNLTFQAQVRVAEILGDFEPGRITMWLNRDYANSGYGYMIANSRKKADLVLAVTDITNREMDHYWKEFLRGENINNTIVRVYDQEHHIGFSRVSRDGKVYFAGNAGGMIDNFLGFGAIRSIESGILAARSVLGRCDYNRVMEPRIAEIKAFGEYRRMLNEFDNDEFDKLLSFIRLPLIKQFIYRNPFCKVKNLVFVPELINRLKTNNRN